MDIHMDTCFIQSVCNERLGKQDRQVLIAVVGQVMYGVVVWSFIRGEQ